MKQFICLIMMILTCVNAKPDHNTKFGEITIIGSSNINSVVLNKQINSTDFTQKNNLYKVDSSVTYLLKLNPNEFYCKSSALKRDFLKLIKYKDYPLINLKATLNFKTITIECDTTTLVLELTIADVTHKYLAQCKLMENNNQLILNGNQTINILDFKLKPQSKFFGFITFNNFVDIKFSFRVLTPQFSQK